jgi:hypothetical protein
LEIGRRNSQRLSEPAHGHQLQGLPRFCAVDAHDADIGLLGEFGLKQSALGAPVAQRGGQDRRRTWRHRLITDGSWLVDASHGRSLLSRCHIPVIYQLSGVWVRCLARVVAVLLVSMTLDVAPVWAESRTSPAATQHALDELANSARRTAQRRPRCAQPTRPRPGLRRRQPGRHCRLPRPRSSRLRSQ